MSDKKTEILFHLKCPLGHIIFLDVDCWTKHILEGHPELAARFDDVQETIIKPDEILESIKKNRRTILYIKKFEGKNKQRIDIVSATYSLTSLLFPDILSFRLAD